VSRLYGRRQGLADDSLQLAPSEREANILGRVERLTWRLLSCVTYRTLSNDREEDQRVAQSDAAKQAHKSSRLKSTAETVESGD
jgi:hypothetical protein